MIGPEVGYYLFANARPAVPFFFDGGAERTTSFLARRLGSKSIHVLQLSVYVRGKMDEAIRNAELSGFAYKSTKQPTIRTLGLKLDVEESCLVCEMDRATILAVERSEFEAVLRAIVMASRPMLMITMLTGSELVVSVGSECNIPTILRVVGPDTVEGFPALQPNTVVLANSPTTAQLCSATYGKPIHYLLELINHDEYECARDDPKYVTFVNPRTKKGLELIAEIARRMLHVQFLIVHGWSRSGYDQSELSALRFLSELPNIHQRQNIADMRQVYSETRVLLVPSMWPESWARVIGEAQCSGIPVLVSDRGSSALQVGLGGVVLSYGNVELWTKTLDRVCRDKKYCGKLSQLARENVNRFPAFDLLKQYRNFFLAVAQRGKSPRLRAQAITGVVFRATQDKFGQLRIRRDTVSSSDAVDFEEPADDRRP